MTHHFGSVLGNAYTAHRLAMYAPVPQTQGDVVACLSAMWPLTYRDWVYSALHGCAMICADSGGDSSHAFVLSPDVDGGLKS